MTELEVYKKRVKELEEFIKIAGHDLREPLRTLKSLCDILKDDLGTNTNNAINEDIQYINSAVGRMEDLINHIYLYYKQSNEQTYKMDVDPEEILSDVMSDLDLKINEKAAIIEWNFNKHVFVDPKQFKQLLTNLINNGIKFCRTQPHVEINQSQENNFDVITIKDNGIGIEKDFLDKIFNPFFRTVSKEEFEGSGLGLSISKRIIENHNGSISVSSEPDLGTTFYIKIPYMN